MEDVNAVKLTVTAFFSALTVLFGWFGWLIIMFIVCMVIDYVTGSKVAAMNGDWNSLEARTGIWRKGGAILVVVVAIIFDMLAGIVVNNVIAIHLPFEYDVLLSPIVLVWYIITELGSIAENAGRMGAPVPEFLQNMIKIFKKTADTAGDKLVPADKDSEG